MAKTKIEVKIRPKGDRVLIKPFTEAELKKGTKSVLILPESMTKEKSAQGKVLAVGEGRYIDGKLVPIRVNVGDVILFSKYGYDEVELENEEFYIIREENILEVIK